MAAKPVLTQKQWDSVENRILAGESIRSIAREFKIGESTIRKRLGARAHQVKDVANKIVAAESAFNELDVGAQIKARTLANDLMAISENMASGAVHGSMTYRKLSRMANIQSSKMDEQNPEMSMSHLEVIAALTNVSTKAAAIPMALMAHVANNKEDDDSGVVTVVHEHAPI